MFNRIIFQLEVLFLGTEVERTPNKNDAIGLIPTGCQAFLKYLLSGASLSGAV